MNLMERLQEQLSTLNIPEDKKTDLRWIQYNVARLNPGKQAVYEVIRLIRKINFNSIYGESELPRPVTESVEPLPDAELECRLLEEKLAEARAEYIKASNEHQKTLKVSNLTFINLEIAKDRLKAFKAYRGCFPERFRPNPKN